MADNLYSLSFTTGAALTREAVDVAVLKYELKDWSKVREHVLKNNIFQARTDSTLKKIYGEIYRRLQLLSDEELMLLASGTEQEQKQMIWLSICKRYTLIKDFALEVLSHQYKAAHYVVNHEDYDAFFNAKAEWHENLDTASKQTKSKARQVLFKMLKECGLVNENNEIVGQQIGARVKDQLQANNHENINIYPGIDE